MNLAASAAPSEPRSGTTLRFDLRRADPYAARPPRTPWWWWAIAGLVLVAGVWLSMRSRVFMDQVWITDHGRVLLEGAAAGSVYMLGDGRSVFFSSGLGPLLAELAFRLTEGAWGFRVLNVLALIAMAWAGLRLAWRWGAPSWAALGLSLVLLFEPSLWQSAALGRADALALAAIFLAVLAAQWAAGELIAGARTDADGPFLDPARRRTLLAIVAAGYGLAALAPALWLTALVLGPLVAVHWGYTLWRLNSAPVRLALPPLLLVFVAVPVLVLALSLVWPSLPGYLASREIRPDADFSSPSLGHFLRDSWQMAATSLPLLLPALGLLLFLRPWWLVVLLGLGYLVVLQSGFYPFRVPYLVPYAWVTLVWAMALAGAPEASAALRRLLLVIVFAALALFGVRLGFAGQNEPPLSGPGLWIEQLPEGAVVGDFSWDFYFPLRRRGIVPLRTFAALPRAEVRAWLAYTRPNVVLYSGIAPQSWTLVEDLNGLLQAAGYCFTGHADAYGRMTDSPRPSRSVPTPALWRLGQYRVHGPYAFWQPCATRSPSPDVPLLPAAPAGG